MGLGNVAIGVATFALPTVRTFKLLERRNAGNVIDEQDFVRELKSWAVYGSLAVTFAAADALVEGVLPLVGVGELGAALALRARALRLPEDLRSARLASALANLCRQSLEA